MRVKKLGKSHWELWKERELTLSDMPATQQLC